MQCLFLYTFHTEFKIEDGKQGGLVSYILRGSVTEAGKRKMVRTSSFLLKTLKEKYPPGGRAIEI